MATVIIKMRLRAHTNTRTNLFIIYIYFGSMDKYIRFSTDKKRVTRTKSNMPLNAFRRRANDVTIIQQNK